MRFRSRTTSTGAGSQPGHSRHHHLGELRLCLSPTGFSQFWRGGGCWSARLWIDQPYFVNPAKAHCNRWLDGLELLSCGFQERHQDRDQQDVIA